eukprot:GILK01008984.1.p1 GENE.GILK01008984.1~~GILK01008984.1.p1  ORF type:complete len:230 (+),score=20.70 GILK01008984.1:76-765(+)
MAVKSLISSPSLPLSKRLVDVLFAIWFFNFWFSVMFTDIHNFTASFRGITVPDLEHSDMYWPPKFLTKVYFMWARTVDPLLYDNPLFWQVMEWINLLTLMPYSAVAIFGFLRGWKWIRIPGIVTASFTFYSLCICIATTLWGDKPSPDVPMFLAIYLPYLIFPALIVWRLAEDDPFATPMSSFKSAVISLVGNVTLSMFFLYVLKWFVMHMPELIPEYARDVVMLLRLP